MLMPIVRVHSAALEFFKASPAIILHFLGRIGFWEHSFGKAYRKWRIFFDFLFK